MLQWVTAGESHGKALVGVLSGVPAGLELTSEVIANALARRRLGYGRGARQKFEEDHLEILSGLRHGKTLGSPIALVIHNSEWPKWTAVMNPDPVDPAELLIDAGTGDEREVSRNKTLTKPRPGHADLAGMLKYDQEDARNILERSSARETATRVALGAIAEAILEQVAGVKLVSHVVGAGALTVPADHPLPGPDAGEQLDDDPMRCFDREYSQLFAQEVDRAKEAGDTLGGLVEVVAYGLPVGLGSHVAAGRRLDARLAAALVSIQAIKGVEIGRAFQQAASRGSAAHDPIVRGTQGLERTSNLAGGIEGGMTNGAPVIVRAALKPISTVPRALPTVDLATGEAAVGLHQRSDTCALAPAAVIAQAEVALTLAQALLEKTGGDSLPECRRNLEAYREYVARRLNWED